METMTNPQRVSPVKNALKWGLITGAALIVLSLIQYATGTMQNKVIQWLSYVLMAIGIVLAIREHRDKELGGYITYGRAVGAGVLTALFTGVLLTVFTYLFYGFIAPAAMAELIRIQEEQLYQNGMSDEQIEGSITILTQGLRFLIVLTMITFMVLVISLIQV